MMMTVRGVTMCGGLACGLAGSTMLATGLLGAVLLSFPDGRAVTGRSLVLAWKLLVRGVHAWRQQCRKPSTNHGSAKWVMTPEAAKAGLFGNQGLIMGRVGDRIVRHPSREANMVVFAPQGSGKGAGIVIPNLLAHPGSVICVDPKGENFAVTAKSRLERGPVWLLSMAEGVPSHGFNPLDTVVIGSGSEVAQAARVAELMMPHEVTNEGHWRTKAVQWATGLILHVAQRFDDEPERRHLGMVHDYVGLPQSSFTRLIDAMGRSPAKLVRDTAASMARSLATNEGLSILSTLEKGTGMFSTGRRSGIVCSRSDFALADLFGSEPASLFLQVPLGDMAEYAPWLRMMVGLANHASMTVERVPDQRPLFLLDEAATLGEIRELQDTIGQGRAFHQKIFIYQDMAQLKKANPGWASVIANCQAQVAFAVNDLDTAEMLSKRLGDETILTRSFGISSGADAVLSHHQNMGQGEHGRRLLQPNEILHLPEHQALVTLQGLGLSGPLRVTRMTYWTEAMFAGQFGTWTGSGATAAHAAVFGEAGEVVPATNPEIGYEPVRRLTYHDDHLHQHAVSAAA